MTDLDLPRLAALAEAATPGPWRTHLADDTAVIAINRWEIAGMRGDYDTDHKSMEANAAYIAAADPTTTLALIRQLQAAEAELAATRAAIAEWRKEHWVATADTTLMETIDRIAEGILE